MSLINLMIDGFCKLFGRRKYSTLKQNYNTLKKHYRISPVHNIVGMDADTDIIFIQLRKDEDPREFKSYLEKKYRKRTGHEVRSLLVIANNIKDIKHLDDIDIDEYIPKYKREEE